MGGSPLLTEPARPGPPPGQRGGAELSPTPRALRPARPPSSSSPQPPPSRPAASPDPQLPGRPREEPPAPPLTAPTAARPPQPSCGTAARGGGGARLGLTLAAGGEGRGSAGSAPCQPTPRSPLPGCGERASPPRPPLKQPPRTGSASPRTYLRRSTSLEVGTFRPPPPPLVERGAWARPIGRRRVSQRRRGGAEGGD